MVNLNTEKLIPLEICKHEKFPKHLNKEFGPKMDEKIWPLVRILNLKGIITIAACEGCYITTGATYKFPWVNISSNTPKDKIMDLEEILSSYNTRHEIHWSVSFNSKSFPVCYSLRPITNAPIYQFQEEISLIAKQIEYSL